jgi:flagellar biosynthesis/type III secretory pathway protein FliH
MPSSDRILKGRASPTGPLAPAGAGPRAAFGGRRVLGTTGAPAVQHAPPGRAAGGAGRAGDGQRVFGAELERVIGEAERRGYDVGRARGEAELAGAVAAAAAFATLLEDAAPRQAPVIAALVAELAVAVASRILDAEVNLEPGILRGALEHAMEGVNSSPEVRVFLHPAAVGPVRDAWVDAHGTAFAGKKWSFEGDPNLAIGGCVVRHDHGFVDAGIEAQLAEVTAAMDKVVPLVGRGREAAA